MMYQTLLLAFFHLNYQLYFVSSIHVNKCIDVCTCDKQGTIICPSAIEVKFKGDLYRFVDIKCRKPHLDDLSVLNRLNISKNSYTNVEIEGCNLYNFSLSDLLDNIGVMNVHDLYITAYNGSLQRKHFENLDKVQTLTVRKCNLGVLPGNTFEGLRNLRMLEIEFSSFSLPKDIFQKNIQLESVNFYENVVSEVYSDLFSNYNKKSKKLFIHSTNNNASFIFDVSKHFNVPGLTDLKLSSVRITTLSHYLKGNYTPSNLHLEDHTIKDFHKLIRELRQGTNISSLRLDNNIATSFQLQPATFADWITLKHITVSKNNLASVPEDAFSRSKNIAEVNLNGNLITTFYKKTFWDLEKLGGLDVSNNRISYLPEGLFARTNSLQILYLSNNLLKNIDRNLFSNLLQLSDLNMSHNKLRYVSGEQFSQLTSLRELDLSHNQLISLVQDPLLSCLDRSVFYNCRELDKLYLQNNSLTEVYDDWRIPLLTQLSKVNLAHNSITDLQGLISMVDGGSELDASFKNNPFNCNCDVIANQNVSKYFNENRMFLENVTCKTPTRLENVEIADIEWSKEQKRCRQLSPEKDKKCPEGCRCVYRPLTRSSVINCQYSGLQTYPRTLPVAPHANHTELNLYGNRLREFRLPDDPGYKNVTFLNLANNSLSALDIRGVSEGLKKLDLRHNNLTTLSEDTLELLEKAGELERLELADNPWNCDVSNYRLATLIYVKPNLSDTNVTCADRNPIEKVIDLYETYKSNRRLHTSFFMSGLLVMLLITVIILTVLYYRNRQRVLVYCFSSGWKVLRWLVSHPDIDDDDKLYDAFIVYAHEDEMLVENHLVPYLEETEERKYKLCLHYRDWIPGEQILSQIGRSVRSSRRTIVVLSPNFLRSVWGVAEFRIAHAEALKDGTARVIVILYEEVADEVIDEELKAYLQTNTYVKWGSPWFWKQLTYALPHPPDRERGVLHYFSRSRERRGDLYIPDDYGMM